MSAEYEPDLELKAELNRLVIVPAVSRTWSDVEARARRASALRRKPGLRVAVYASIAVVVVAAVAVGSIVGVGRLGERRFALVIPETAYAATGAQSGHWERLPLPTSEGLGVSVLVMDPTNPSVVYAATEEGVFKTSDGAESWKKISTLGAWGIAVDSASPATVYLTAHERLLRSDDGGATWTDLSGPGLPPESDWIGMANVWLDPTTSPSTLYKPAYHREVDLPGYRRNWTGSTYRSTDRGETWTELTEEEAELAGEMRYQAGLKAIPPSDAAQFLDLDEVFGVPGMVETIPLTDADTGYVLHVTGYSGYCTASGDPSIVYVGTGEGVFKSTDGGRTWRKASAGMVSSSAVLDVVPDPRSPSTLYAAATAGILKTTDGGGSWTLILPGQGSVVVALSAPSTLYAWTSAGLFRTDNGGADWTQLAAAGLVSSGEYEGRAVQRAVGELLLVATDHPEIVFALAATNEGSGGLFRSTDGGNTWSQVVDVDPDPWDRCRPMVAAGPLDPSAFYAIDTSFYPPGTEDELWQSVVKSTDAGATWTVVSPQEWTGTWFSDVVVDPHTPSDVYVVRDVDVVRDNRETSTRSVSRSLDGGTTWEDVELGGLAKNIARLRFDPRSPDTLYVLTHSSVDKINGTERFDLYRSTDGGATWQNIIGELADTSFTQDLSIIVDPAPGGGLYATSGNELFKWVPGGN